MWSSSGCRNTPSQWTQSRSSWRGHLFFDVSKPITFQCYASQSGLGAVLLIDSQSVCYASRALSHLVVWQVWPIPLQARRSHNWDWPWTTEVHIQKKKFTSHPNVCSECGWPYKSTTLKCNARKVHSCILHMHWVGYSWRPLMECRRSCVRFIYLRQLIMKSIFKLNHRNKMFFMIKLQQMVIFRNLSVLSS